MLDPRKPRPLKPRALGVLVLDANTFGRGLIADILRSLNVTDIWPARTEAEAHAELGDHRIDLIMLSWDEGDAIDALAFVRRLRHLPDERRRRLPVVLVTAGLTRQMVIAGRDAGVDEFLAKPIAPVALRQRLEMVIETPRPFVDCSAYVGPCRRRKNPADYYGPKRRDLDRADAGASPLVDADEEAAKSPIRLALAQLRLDCTRIRPGRRDTLEAVAADFRAARDLAAEMSDHALHSALAAFEAYISVAAPQGQLEEHVVATALSALEQLSVLPPTYTDARSSVAVALGRAIQKKLAA